MTKICVNGIIREATPAEEEQMAKWEAELPATEPTAEERLAEVEEKLDILDIILGGA
jgi:hypothetical protein